ncbi:mechanosensitive ion channel family protein [Dinghuibacter silviterrae]|uniref:Small-conductance mechanosensitive channel n=1 Tax=Dinghuibacter silviterrae TaxID=1539049 RepID=A0A4R8DKT4_9BACT|nr:mechanosensitive ion channel domain-containing protein [Dinghuibacter silviterrae]TDW97620.1 small-conductance mechanosensitive channel [Dinghuibacter silviterrae]
MLTFHLPDLVFDLLLFAAAIAAGLLVKFVLARISRRYKEQQAGQFSLWRSLLTRLGEPINIFIPLLLFNLLVPFLRLGTPYKDPIDKTVEICFDISVAFFLIAMVKVGEDYMYHRYDISKPINLKERKVRTQLQFIRKILVVLIILVAACVILLSFDSLRKMGASLLTGVGVGGIIIGFAAQRSLGALLAGFQIAFTQPLRIDDVLVVEGEWGRVEEITLTYVVLNIWDQRRLILPITYFVEKPFQNWTRTTADLLASVMFYLDYRTPVDAIRREVNQILENEPRWDKRVNVVHVTDLRERVMEVRVLLSARNSGDAFELRCKVREKIIAFLQEYHPESLPVDRFSVPQTLFDTPGAPAR